MQDLQLIRVQAARDLIISSDLPLKAIAQNVGLADPSHLSRIFRKYFDAAPAYFRRE